MTKMTDEIADYAVVFESDDGWYWRAMSFNGKKVAIGGEPFDSESNARRAVVNLFPRMNGGRVFEDGSADLEAFLEEARNG